MRHRFSRLGVILGLILTIVTMAPAAAQASTAMVGTSTIQYDSAWTLSSSSTPQMAYLIHNAPGAESSYTYLEVDNAQLPIMDALYVIEVMVMPAWRESFGIDVTPYLVQGPASTDVIWELFSAEMPQGPMLVLMSADLTRVPGKTAVELMMASPDNFPAAFAAAQTGITTNGHPNQFSLIDTATVLNGAGITAQANPGQQQPPQAQPTQPAVAATTPAQPPQSAATATVGSDTLTYGGEWQYSADNSDATSGLFQSTANSQLIYGYFTATGDGSDGGAALQQFNQGFFGDFEPATVRELPGETLPNGSAWSLHVIDEEGGTTVYLTLADASTPATIRFQVLSSPLDLFQTTLTSVQQSIQVNGIGAFAGIDPAHATSLIGAAPAPATIPAGQATNTPPVAATSGCDSTGSVITDPSQRPVTQADIDQRSACVGGGTYVASCGTFAVGETSTDVQCTVNVAILGAPMTVSYQHFTLVDAAGNRYPVDLEVVWGLVVMAGAYELPEATVQTGMTSSGTLVFDVPNNAPMPWIIEVAPDTIAATGEQPGTLVIEGALQDFSVFGG
jgi:hypothetical protein